MALRLDVPKRTRFWHGAYPYGSLGTRVFIRGETPEETDVAAERRPKGGGARS